MLPPSIAGPRAAPEAPVASVPELTFQVEGVSPKVEATTPTLDFTLAIEAAGAAGAAGAEGAAQGGTEVRSVLLDVQVRLVVSARAYTADTRARLSEVMGDIGGRNTVGSLFWARVVVTVPPFTGSTRIDIPVPCTYDAEVAVAKYFQAVEDGTVPVELLFSGSLFWNESGQLRTARIPWDREAKWNLPVAVWRELMDRHFPGASWIRLGPDAFDRLARWKAARSIPSWDKALDELLDAASDAEGVLAGHSAGTEDPS